MRKIKTLLAILALAALPLVALASPGGLDKFGGHTDHKTGEYHFHQLDGKKLAEPLPGEDPDKNGGKIVYKGTPKFSGEEASKPKAAKAEKAEKVAAPTAVPEKAAAPAAEPKTEKKAKKSKKAKAEAAVMADKAEKKDAAPAADDKAPKKPKKAKKSRKEKADEKAAK